MAKRSVNRKEEDGVGAFVFGALLGGIVGGIAAFWFAPQSGEETRHDIEHRVKDVRDEITELGENVTHTAQHTAQTVRRRIEGESVEETLEAAKAEARRYQEEALRR
jgi:gas vesicle protein